MFAAEGLVHVAYGKAAAAVGSGPNTAQFTQLSSKVETLIRTNLQVNVFPDISKRVSMLQGNHLRDHARPFSSRFAKRDACVMVKGTALRASRAPQAELMLLLACRWRGCTLG